MQHWNFVQKLLQKNDVFEIDSKITNKPLFYFSRVLPEFANSPLNFKDTFDFVKKHKNHLSEDKGDLVGRGAGSPEVYEATNWTIQRSQLKLGVCCSFSRGVCQRTPFLVSLVRDALSTPTRPLSWSSIATSRCASDRGRERGAVNHCLSSPFSIGTCAIAVWTIHSFPQTDEANSNTPHAAL